MMGGWKTWLGAALLAAVGGYQIHAGDLAGGAQKIAEALAVIGIGHKIEKSTPAPTPR
jgi:hypothetical protein